MSAHFPQLINDRIIRLIKGETVTGSPPVWVMRQAGRYLPEFQEIRKSYDFFQMVRNPEVACRITLQPIERYNMDAAIIFSDILILCQALGMEVEMIPGVGPYFPKVLHTPEDIGMLNFNFCPDQQFKYLKDSISLTRIQLNGRCPLIGFAGAPWTLFAYMSDIRTKSGGSARLFTNPRKWLYKYPIQTLELLKNISSAIIKLLKCQYDSGAQILMLFESHAEVLNRELFEKYSLPLLNMIVEETRREINCDVPFGAHYAIDLLLKSSFDVIGIDWTVPITEELLSTASKYKKTLMGNLDPGCLLSTKEKVSEETLKMINSFKGAKYIANLGHGIYPETDPELLQAFVDTIRSKTFNKT